MITDWKTYDTARTEIDGEKIELQGKWQIDGDWNELVSRRVRQWIHGVGWITICGPTAPSETDDPGIYG